MMLRRVAPLSISFLLATTFLLFTPGCGRTMRVSDGTTRETGAQGSYRTPVTPSPTPTPYVPAKSGTTLVTLPGEQTSSTSTTVVVVGQLPTPPAPWAMGACFWVNDPGRYVTGASPTTLSCGQPDYAVTSIRRHQVNYIADSTYRDAMDIQCCYLPPMPAWSPVAPEIANTWAHDPGVTVTGATPTTTSCAEGSGINGARLFPVDWIANSTYRDAIHLGCTDLKNFQAKTSHQSSQTSCYWVNGGLPSATQGAPEQIACNQGDLVSGIRSYQAGWIAQSNYFTEIDLKCCPPGAL